MNITIRATRRLLVFALVAASAGCAQLGQLGTLGDVLGTVLTGGGGGQSEVVAEVQQVDTRSQQIHVRTQDGRTGAVGYDQRTRVIYRQQEYPVHALEHGDIVAMRLQQDQRGNAYTDLIQVQQSVQERGGGTQQPGGQLQRLEGSVGQIDHNRGLFELRTRNAGTIVVSLPYNPRSTDADRFRRLRSGDNVRVEGHFLSQNRLELQRFL